MIKQQYYFDDCFLDLKKLSARTCLSVSSLRDHIKNPSHPVPSYRVGGKILINWIEFKDWIKHFRNETIDLDKVVDEVIRDL